MEKKNKFSIDKLILFVMGGIILVNGLLRLFVTKQPTPFALGPDSGLYTGFYSYLSSPLWQEAYSGMEMEKPNGSLSSRYYFWESMPGSYYF